MLNTNLLLRANYDVTPCNRFSIQAQGRSWAAASVPPSPWLIVARSGITSTCAPPIR
jgi:hypothetical protein